MAATIEEVTPEERVSQPSGDGLSMCVTPMADAVPALLLLELLETHKQRQDILRTENGIGNRIEAVYRRKTGMKAEERARFKKKASTGMGLEIIDTPIAYAHPADDSEGGGHAANDTHIRAAPALAQFLYNEAVAALQTMPLTEARELLARSRKPLEKRMEAMARELPVWHWAEGVRGFGALGLAQIVGECGDLANYDGPAKVWKRMGLAVIDGERQRKHTNADEALAHGYNPQRRSIMYVIADSLMKGNRDGEYRTYYLAEKERQREKLPDAPAAHIDNRARRHLAKRLLRDLWRAWRAILDVAPTPDVPDHAPTDLAAD